MAAYNFQKRFVPMITSGRKLQTIRREGKRIHARPGERVQLYTGMRTTSCRKIVEPDPVCLAVQDIAIAVGEHRIEFIHIDHVRVQDFDNHEFAVSDGFEDMDDFHAFWRDFHGVGFFEGLLIRWGHDE